MSTAVFAGCTAQNSKAEDVTTTTQSSKSDSIDYMALVNKTHALPDNWEKQLKTVHIKNSIGDDVEVEKKAYDAYLKLKADLKKDKIEVDLDSARRSVAEQQRIMDDYTKKYGADYAAKTVAKPGYSEHHTGLALDLYLIINGKDVTENEDMIKYKKSGQQSTKSSLITDLYSAISRAANISQATATSLGISAILTM